MDYTDINRRNCEVSMSYELCICCGQPFTRYALVNSKLCPHCYYLVEDNVGWLDAHVHRFLHWGVRMLNK